MKVKRNEDHIVNVVSSAGMLVMPITGHCVACALMRVKGHTVSRKLSNQAGRTSGPATSLQHNFLKYKITTCAKQKEGASAARPVKSAIRFSAISPVAAAFHFKAAII
jgi:hypothetical protein